ncbi:MAG: CdaR family protein [Defluviitaleaceae bacterium]|nr:CdaR family protein [Defluviitaleaceae bacterium]
MKKLKLFFTKNIIWKVFAVSCSFALWLTAMEINNPSGNFFTHRPLVFRNFEYLNQNNLVLLNEASLRALMIPVTVQSRASTIIREEEVFSYINFEELEIDENNTESRTKILPVHSEIRSLSITNGYVINTQTRSVTLQIDTLSRVTLEIEPVVIEEPMDNYSFGNINRSNEYIIITGPSTIVNSIKRAIVNIDLSEVNYDISITLPINLIDSYGNEVSSNLINTNITSVTLDIPIANTVTVNINTPNVIGNLPTNFFVENVSISPNTVQLFGNASDLSGIGNVSLGEINIDGLNSSTYFEINLNSHFSEDITILTNNIVRVFVDIRQEIPPVEILEPSIFNVQIPTTQIEIIGNHSGVYIQEHVNASFFENLNPSDIRGHISVEDLPEGLHYVLVNLDINENLILEPVYAIVTIQNQNNYVEDEYIVDDNDQLLNIDDTTNEYETDEILEY